MTFYTIYIPMLPVELTPEASPAGDVAGSIVRQDFSRVGETGRHDGV